MNFLTQMGVAQAEQAAYKLRYTGLKFKHMISSEMTRARHTMAIIAEITGDWQRDFVIDKCLNERDNDPSFGELRKKQEYQIHRRFVSGSYRINIQPYFFEGNTLVVTHHYTMEILFECMGFDPQILWKGKDARIPNCVPYIWDLDKPKELLVLNDDMKTPIIEEV